MIRRLKIAYLLYNFFHKKELVYNVSNYKKLGINKKYFSPVSSQDFKHLPQQKTILELEKLCQTSIY